MFPPLERDVVQMGREHYDVLIVGGGIFGCCVAWDAAQRGLSVALVERGDFAAATSANCFKIVHGGIRYLQHADLVRLRQSSRERRILLRIAPHLVSPLPIVVPTYGRGRRGKAFLGLGLHLYDLLTWDRNAGIRDPARRVPGCRFLSRAEVLDEFPQLEPAGLTGGAIFHDAQMYSPPRLALAFLRSAARAGARPANYVEATGFLTRAGQICGVKVRDRLTGEVFELKARVVINTAGPWAEELVASVPGAAPAQRSAFSRDAYLVTRRPAASRFGLAVPAKTRDPDAIVSRDARHLFIVPWRDRLIVGVWHVVHSGAADAFTVTRDEIDGFLGELNAVHPGFALRIDEIALWNAGLVLFGRNRPGAVDLSYGKRSRFIDHGRAGGPDGLLTLIGVRYTTARGEAARLVDRVLGRLGRRAPASRTAVTAIFGGEIEDIERFSDECVRSRPRALDEAAAKGLVRNYGSEYRRVLRCAGDDPAALRRLGDSTVTAAEVVHAVREEMAVRLEDVVFRRTDLGGAGHPGEAALAACATIMARELGWNTERIGAEIEAVEAQYRERSPLGARHPPLGRVRSGGGR